MNYGNYAYDDSQRTLDSAFSNLSFNKNEENNNDNNKNKNNNIRNVGTINNENITSRNRGSNINSSNDSSKNNNNSKTDDTINVISVPPSTFSYLNNNSSSNKNNDNTYSPTMLNNTDGNENNSDTDTMNSLKIDLQIKETQIQALENEVRLYKKLINDDLKFNQGINTYNNVNNSILDSIEEDENDEDTLNKIIIPENMKTILYTLSTKLRETQEKLKATEDHLESILCAIALNPSNSITKDGRYDVETIAHKIIVRLEILTKENKEMAKMLSYGKSKEINIELNLAKRENMELKGGLSFV